MNLKTAEMRPGKVLKVLDSKGTIKASCVGYFSEEDDPDKLPPVIPWPTASRTAYTAPQVGDLLWVVIFHDNPLALFYMFRRDSEDNDSELSNNYKDVEIQMKRTDPNDRSKPVMEVSYNSDDGYKIANGGDSATVFQIDNNTEHDVHINHSSGTSISIQKDKISLGTDGQSKYSAVVGEPLCDALSKICSAIEAMLNACNTPQTAPLKTALAQLQIAKSSCSKSMILSKKVSLE